MRELIEETKDAVGDTCAVAVRFSADEGGEGKGDPIIGEHREMIEMLAELPDLWDININSYSAKWAFPVLSRKLRSKPICRMSNQLPPSRWYPSVVSPRLTPWFRRSIAALSILSAPHAFDCRSLPAEKN